MQHPSPFRTMMRYKCWATDGLNAVIAESFERIDAHDRMLILRLLDHIQSVDEIFSHNLAARPHTYLAPRSVEIPCFEALVSRAGLIGAWYVDYADSLTPEKRDETIDFAFSNGASASMTRGEMLLHIAMHGTYHRGNVGILLQKNGIEPHPDRMTDFLETNGACPDRQAPLAEVTVR